jgi:hypothetical protein
MPVAAVMDLLAVAVDLVVPAVDLVAVAVPTPRRPVDLAAVDAFMVAVAAVIMVAALIMADDTTDPDSASAFMHLTDMDTPPQSAIPRASMIRQASGTCIQVAQCLMDIELG